MKNILIQTSDPVEYAAMLEATSRTTREFCRRHGLEYRNFIGVKQGLWPWHSTYNRLHMMKELLDENHRGWVLYLDADAYIYDLEFSIAEYLEINKQSAMIAVRANSSAEYWDINAGVLLINFDNCLARTIVRDLIRRLEQASQGTEFFLNKWPAPDLLMDDQGILNCAFIENPGWQSAVHYEFQSLMNSMHASFIRHHLRAVTPDLSERIKSIQAEVEYILSADRT
jgi:lipopolysaccharide biosynthesis glycosyltransferase